MLASEKFGIAAEQNVRAATGHVGGYGDRAFAAGLRDYARFTLVLLGVEHLVRDSGFFQDFRNGFGFFDGDRAYQNRLAALVIMANAVRQRIVFLQNAVHDGFKFFLLGAIDDFRIFPADQGAIGGNHHDVEVINFSEFGRFRFRCAGHAGKFFVHAEIILEGDGRERLVFALDLYAFFGFHGLVQTVGPAATGHLASGKFVYDHDFAVFVHVVDVDPVERMRTQSLVDVVHRVDVRGVGHVSQAEEALALVEALFSQRRLAMLFIYREINVLDELRNDFVDLEILVRGFFGRAGDDERGARFVDQDGVDFVHDSEVMAALHAMR